MNQKLDSAQTFILKNARLLERRLFDFLFQNGSQEKVLSALLAYQNEDGGFGNALEPDKRTSTSQPIDQEVGLQVLDEVGFEPEVALRVCDFLQTITTPEGGVPFVLPSVRDAPRAPWWNTDVDEPPASVNPTGSILGFLYKNNIHHPWMERAEAFCWQQIENLESDSGHLFLAAMGFLENVSDRVRAEHAFEQLSGKLLEGGHVALDPHASGYALSPLTFAPSPRSLCRRLFDDATIQAHLEALAQKQQEDGGWPISWTAVSPACELEYRGIVTIGALKTLMAYGYPG